MISEKNLHVVLNLPESILVNIEKFVNRRDVIKLASLENKVIKHFPKRLDT